MLQKSSEDLFAESTMTFGEHLEELRICLFRALIGLGIGFLIGLLVGRYVVLFIQTPLTAALKDYYEKADLAELEALAAAQEGDDRETVAGLKPLIKDEHLVFRQYWLEVRELAAQLRYTEVEELADRPLPVNPPGHSPSILGPNQVLASDLSDPGEICARLVAAAEDAESQPYHRLWTALDRRDRDRIAALNNLSTWDEKQRGELAAVLDELLSDRSLYDASAFESVSLRHEAKRLAAQQATLDRGQVRRLNRLLLEAAFPGAIAKTYPDMVGIRLWQPVAEIEQVRPDSLSAHEPFVVYIKAALVTGIVISSPWVFWQLWSFVAAGLYPNEKRYVHIFLPFSIGLFLLGAGMAFFFVFEPVLRFLFSFNQWLGIDPRPRINEWLSFVLMLPLGFGISFQLPLVMLFLERIGIFTVETYKQKWRIAVLVIFVIAMIMTPSDPTSMLLLALPLCVLYVGGILLCKYMPAARNPLEAV